MEVNEFSEIKKSVFNFFETKIKKSDLFKAKDKVNKKREELKKSSEKDKVKKEEQLSILLEKLNKQRIHSLAGEIPDFLTESAEKAVSVDKPMFKVTHPVKFTHGLAPYGGCYVKPSVSKINYAYLTTESLKSHYFDITNSNGNLITHARFLMCNLDGETVYEKLQNNDSSWLNEFSQEPKIIDAWMEGLRLWEVSEAPVIQDASLLKQSYFYLSDGTYHITSPLFSSTICQSIYEKIRFSIFSQENKILRKAKREKKYEEGTLVEFPNYAVMSFGGSQPQNISAGNFERHGEAFLLSCSAPQWKSSLKPPVNQSSLFMGEFDNRAWRVAKDLQFYLLKRKGKKGNMEIRNHVVQLVYQLIDILLNYVSEIHSLENQAGWSKESELKESHKLWLDVHRQDEEFQRDRESGEWQSEVCRDFGKWLNKKLESKKTVFAKIESDHWAKLLKRQLREFELDIKIDEIKEEAS